METYKYNTAYNDLSADTVYDAATNKPFSSAQEFLNAGGDWNTIQTRQAPTDSFYKYADNPTVYRGSDNYAFTSEQDFLSKGGDWNAIQVRPTVPVNATPTTQTTSNTLTTQPKTQFDLNSSIQRNQTMMQNYFSSLGYTTGPDGKMTYTASPEQAAAQKQYNDLQGQYDRLNLQATNIGMSTQAGMNAIEDKPIPGVFITGQQAALQRQANDQLRTVAYQQQAVGVNLNAVARNLESITANRAQLSKAYEMALSFGREDISVAMQLQQIQRQEAMAAKEMALQYGVTKPYYNIGGTVYRTSDGYAFTSEQDFLQKAGIPVGQAEGAGQIQLINPAAMQTQELVGQLMGEYWDAGILPTDSLETAKAKIQANSTIWKTAMAEAQSSIAARRSSGPSATTVRSKEESRVKQIISLHPGEWGHAADQIDAEFGPGTATKYDDLLKAEYSDASNASAKETAAASTVLNTRWWVDTYKVDEDTARSYVSLVKPWVDAGFTVNQIIKMMTEE